MKRPEGVAGSPQQAEAPKSAAKGAPAKRVTRRAASAAAQATPTEPARPKVRERAAASAPAAKTREPHAPSPRALARARRRVERDEVKRFTRRARRRRTGWFLAGLVVVAVAGLVVIAVFSPLLSLRTITVDGTSRLNAPTLQKAVGSQLGTPLALVNYETITRELAPYHLIQSYVTEIVPPDTLVIHIVERTPVGAIQTTDAFDLVDPAGVVVETSKTRPTGYPLIQLGGGRIDGPGYASMAQVLLALPPAVLSKVDTITAQTHDDVTLTLTGLSQRVVWGSSDGSDAKARVLADLIALHADSGPGEYDVSAAGTAVFHRD